MFNFMHCLGELITIKHQNLFFLKVDLECFSRTKIYIHIFKSFFKWLLNTIIIFIKIKDFKKLNQTPCDIS